MNELISLTRSDVLEIRNYEKSDVPIAFYPNLVKKRGTIFLVNKHMDIELLFITAGEMKIHLDDEVFYAEAGDVVVINPNVLHNIIPLTETVCYECMIVDRSFLNTVGMSLDHIYVQEVIKDCALFAHIYAIKEQLLTNKTGYYAAKVYCHIIECVLILLEKYAIAKQDNRAESSGLLSIEKAVSYIHEHFNKAISVEEIAAHIGYSKFYFCRRFKEITGYTVATYINMQRIKYAQSLLTESDKSINEIAFECGFASVAYFSATFKRYMGISPSRIQQ